MPINISGRKQRFESQKNPDQVSFTNSCESYAWYDQDSLSWKTWQRSLIMDWTSFSESFPKQGTMQNGQLYLRVHWEPVTQKKQPPRSVVVKQTTMSTNPYQLRQQEITKGLQRENFSEMEREIWAKGTTRCLNPDWRSYVSKPILRRGDDGLSYRVDRTKALGNSVVPQVAAIPLKRVHDLYYNE